MLVCLGVRMSQHPYLGYVRTLKNGTRVDTNVDIHRSRRRPAPQQEPKRGYECPRSTIALIRGAAWAVGDSGSAVMGPIKTVMSRIYPPVKTIMGVWNVAD